MKKNNLRYDIIWITGFDFEIYDHDNSHVYSYLGQNKDMEYHWVYNIAVSCWILIGLAWVANLIANCQEIYEDIGGEVIESDDEEDSKDQAMVTRDQINQAQVTTKVRICDIKWYGKCNKCKQSNQKQYCYKWTY